MSNAGLLSPSALRPIRVLVLIAVLTAAMFGAAAAGGGADKAHAYSADNFCYNPIQWIPAGGRCVDSRRVRHRYVQANIYSGTGGPGNYCVGAKQYSDGTGGNTIAFGCRPSSVSWTQTGPVSLAQSNLGYATLINTTGAEAVIWGYMQWYP